MATRLRHSIAATRAIGELAQAEISFDQFVEECLDVLDETFGFDTAYAARCEPGAAIITKGSNDTEPVRRTLRYASTRYASVMQPVFERSARFGVVMDWDFYHSQRVRNSCIYHREVLAPTGVRSMLQLCARWRGRSLLRINLNRHGLHARPFQSSDREAAQALLPTLEASITARLATEQSRSLLPSLTQREAEVAELVAKGLTSAQIGLALGTSPHTVRNQLSRIYEKLDVGSRAELAALVVQRRAL